jgi:pyruvyltransferase
MQVTRTQRLMARAGDSLLTRSGVVRRRIAIPPYPHVELVWWIPAGHFLNFGDALAHVIVAQMLARHGRSLMDETERPARLLAIGSILHYAKDGDVIWGTGVNGKSAASDHQFTSLDVRAVRGPLTRDFLRKLGIEAPEIYGDPALLLPTLFGGAFRATGTQPYAVMPNLYDLDLLNGVSNVVSPLLGWNRCVERILESRLVIASSLHAIIVAEAFGIPARYVRLSETEHLFKYEDYVLGTGRTRLDYARSVGEAVEMGGMPATSFDAERLLQSFPIDLWR